MFFSKAEYKELELPFVCDINPDDLYAGLVSIEAYGDVFGEIKYCYASYFVDVKDIDEITALLADTFNKKVKVIFKIKKGEVKDFKFDLKSLAHAYNDDRLINIELVCWGLNDKSIREPNML